MQRQVKMVFAFGHHIFPNYQLWKTGENQQICIKRQIHAVLNPLNCWIK